MWGGGGAVDRATSGGVGEDALGSMPFPQSHPPNCPLPQPQHLVHTGAVPARQIPSNGQGLQAGSGVHVGGVGLVPALLGGGGARVKKGPLQPLPGAREGRHPMVATCGHHQQHVPPLHPNGVSAHLRRLPQGRPPLAPARGTPPKGRGNYLGDTWGRPCRKGKVPQDV